MLTTGGTSNCSREELQTEQWSSAEGKVTRIDLEAEDGSH